MPDTERGLNVALVAMSTRLAEVERGYVDVRRVARDMAEALRGLKPAVESLMAEMGGKHATDWGVVNNALVARSRTLAAWNALQTEKGGYTQEELAEILKAHALWLADSSTGSRADLSRAHLSWAHLSGADLSRADLSWANLSGGTTWEQYLSEVVPAFLTGGGKSLAEVLATGCWDSHDWSNCPTHAAYGAENLGQVPIQWRLEASRFIELFDAKAIPMPTLGDALTKGDAK